MSARYPISVRKVLDEWRFFVEEGAVGSEGIRRREEWRFFSGPHRIVGSNPFTREVGEPNPVAQEVEEIIGAFDVLPERDSVGYVWASEGDAQCALRKVYLTLESRNRKR